MRAEAVLDVVPGYRARSSMRPCEPSLPYDGGDEREQPREVIGCVLGPMATAGRNRCAEIEPLRAAKRLDRSP
jgi:hypothetical protein